MTINGINGVNAQMGQMGMNQTEDSYSRSIQKQIVNAQKALQDISSNEDMTLEEKMKKRQEIQQEIAELNRQLRQHQIEQRKEQQSKATSMDDMLGGSQGTARPEGSGSGLSQASMTAMISADSSMKQAQVQGSVATRMEDRAGILKSEIKQDKGGNTKHKEAELAEVEKKAMNAAASQMNTLKDANQAVEEAKEAEQGSKSNEADAKAESRDSKADKAERNGQETGEVSESKAGNTGVETVIDIRL